MLKFPKVDQKHRSWEQHWGDSGGYIESLLEWDLGENVDLMRWDGTMEARNRLWTWSLKLLDILNTLNNLLRRVHGYSPLFFFFLFMEPTGLWTTCPLRIFLRSGLAVLTYQTGSPYPKKHLRWTHPARWTSRFSKMIMFQMMRNISCSKLVWHILYTL